MLGWRKTGTKLAQNWYQMIPKWYKMKPKWYNTGTKLVQMIPKRYQNGTRLVQNDTKLVTKVLPNWYKIGRTLSENEQEYQFKN